MPGPPGQHRPRPRSLARRPRPGRQWRAAGELRQGRTTRACGADLDPVLYDKAGGGERPLLWVVDPHGNLVLRYDAKANGLSC